MSLAESTARGAVWTIVTSIGGRAVGVLGTVAMTRFLAPEVVGDVSAATIIVMTASWLTTWGFGPYVVVKGRGPDAPEIVWHATLAYVVLGLAVLVPMAFLGDVFAPLVNAENAARYIPGMALVYLLKRITAMPERILVRDMRFRALGLATAFGELVYTGVALTCAVSGLGGMSVVIGNLVQTCVVSALILRATGFASWATPTRFSARRVYDMLRFGAPLAIEGIAHNASRYWDNLLIARTFGTSTMGAYNMAYNLADIPAVQIGEQISSVLLPSMSAMPPERRPAALERSTALLSLIIFPMAVGLGLIADPLIAVVLPSDKWQEVAPLLTVLATLSVFRPLTWVLSTYMEAQDRTARMMFLEVAKLGVMLLGIYLLAPFGAVVAAGAVGFAFGLNAAAGVAMVVIDDRGEDGPSARRLLIGFLQPLLACGVMAGVVLLLRFEVLEGSGLPVAVVLAAEIVAGGVAYVAAALVLCRATARDLLSLLKKIARRKS